MIKFTTPNQDILDKAAKIKLLILDVDGVLTDGKLFFGANNIREETKGYNVKDGLGISLALKAGIEIAVITGRVSRSVNARLLRLGIKHVYQGLHNKNEAYLELKKILNVSSDEVAYVGDDIIDLPVINKVGLPIAVNDAHPELIKRCSYITSNKGGNGAVREVCDIILEAQNKLEDIISYYLDM